MVDERNELDELSREIRRIISENEKFLSRVMDDEFEFEDEDDTGEDDKEITEEI